MIVEMNDADTASRPMLMLVPDGTLTNDVQFLSYNDLNQAMMSFDATPTVTCESRGTQVDSNSAIELGYHQDQMCQTKRKETREISCNATPEQKDFSSTTAPDLTDKAVNTSSKSVRDSSCNTIVLPIRQPEPSKSPKEQKSAKKRRSSSTSSSSSSSSESQSDDEDFHTKNGKELELLRRHLSYLKTVFKSISHDHPSKVFSFTEKYLQHIINLSKSLGKERPDKVIARDRIAMAKFKKNPLWNIEDTGRTSSEDEPKRRSSASEDTPPKRRLPTGVAAPNVRSRDKRSASTKKRRHESLPSSKTQKRPKGSKRQTTADTARVRSVVGVSSSPIPRSGRESPSPRPKDRGGRHPTTRESRVSRHRAKSRDKQESRSSQERRPKAVKKPSTDRKHSQMRTNVKMRLGKRGDGPISSVQYTDRRLGMPRNPSTPRQRFGEHCTSKRRVDAPDTTQEAIQWERLDDVCAPTSNLPSLHKVTDPNPNAAPGSSDITATPSDPTLDRTTVPMSIASETNPANVSTTSSTSPAQAQANASSQISDENTNSMEEGEIASSSPVRPVSPPVTLKDQPQKQMTFESSTTTALNNRYQRPAHRKSGCQNYGYGKSYFAKGIYPKPATRNEGSHISTIAITKRSSPKDEFPFHPASTEGQFFSNQYNQYFAPEMNYSKGSYTQGSYHGTKQQPYGGYYNSGFY